MNQPFSLGKLAYFGGLEWSDLSSLGRFIKAKNCFAGEYTFFSEKPGIYS